MEPSYDPDYLLSQRADFQTAQIDLQIEPVDPSDLIRKKGVFMPNGLRGGKVQEINIKRLKGRRKSPDIGKNGITLPDVNTSTTENSLVMLPASLGQSKRRPVKSLGQTTKSLIQRKIKEDILKEKQLKVELGYQNEASTPTNYDDRGMSSSESRVHTGNCSLVSSVTLGTPQTTKSLRGMNVISIGKHLEMKRENTRQKSQAGFNSGLGSSLQNEILIVSEVSELNTKINPTFMYKKRNVYGIIKENEEREIKHANEKIKEFIQRNLIKNYTLDNMFKTSSNSQELLKKIKANFTKASAERTYILVLFDQDLEFLEEYLKPMQFSLKLVFEKLENYKNVIDWIVKKDQPSAYNCKSCMPYFCFFVFLKFYPKVKSKSFEILKELMKLNCCYIIKCTFTPDNGNLKLHYDHEPSDEWRRNFEYMLILKWSKFSTLTVTYEEFGKLQQYIISKSKFFLDTAK